MTRLLIIGLPACLILLLLFAGNGAFAGSLYRCVMETGGTIYTDNPAQLNQCSPIAGSGAITSLATVSSGGPPMGRLPDPPPVPQVQPEPMVTILPSESLPPVAAVLPSSSAPNPLPCPDGINPINPYSAPPCPTAEALPSATITRPSGPGAPQDSPTQP
jgi:hypothetical protein